MGNKPSATRDLTLRQFHAALERNVFFRPRGDYCKSKDNHQKRYVMAFKKDGTLDRRATIACLIKQRANASGRYKWFLQFSRPIVGIQTTAPVTKISELERKRRKYDKFVKPKGEKAQRPRTEKATQEIKPKAKSETPVSSAAPAHTDYFLIEEPHHENWEDGNVLYKGSEMLGEFNFRDTILQQLDRYFFYIKRMKQTDPDAFGFYRKIGATIIPYLANGAWNRGRETETDQNDDVANRLPDWFNETRPSFGCFAFGADPETEKFEKQSRTDNKDTWVPKFLYFLKSQMPPSDVQPMRGGDVYILTVWWDRPDKKNKHGIPQDLPIFISDDGETILPLKTLKTEFREIRSKRHHDSFQVPVRRWTIEKEYKNWAKDNGKEVNDFLTSLFIRVVQTIETSNMVSSVRVSVIKNRMRATFSVNAARTAYFFQDRDIEVSEKGARKPIFHAVRAHVRADGSTVKMHFRGARQFSWAGYRVEINVPGYHHKNIDGLNIGFINEERAPVGEKTATLPQLGNTLSKLIYREATNASR